MTLPNKITFFRLFLTPFAIAFLFIDIPFNYLIAMGLFIIGSGSDLVDGYIARKYKMVSKLGIFLDPLVDKVFNYCIAMSLLYLNVLPLWIVLLLFARDIFADAFRNLAVKNKDFVPAIYTGKLKSLFLSFAIIVAEFSLAVEAGFNFFDISYDILRNGAYVCLLLALLIGFVGTTSILQSTWKDMTGKYKI